MVHKLEVANARTALNKHDIFKASDIVSFVILLLALLSFWYIPYYFSEKELEEYVLLDPQWVVDALKSIITAEPFLKNKMEIRERWMELKKTGKLTMDIIGMFLAHAYS